MLWVTMYVTLTDIQNGEPVYLASVPCTACGGLEVALCELTYYHRWFNIGAELLNNKVSDGRTVLDIPDGYYNVCELDKEAFRPLGAELSLHAPTGRLQLSAKKRLILNGGLAKLLGFSRETFEPGQSHIADEPNRLAIHWEICVHLAEVSTSENIHNGRPSTLLKSVPFENERCGGGRTVIPSLAVQTAGIRTSFPADAHDIRHEWQKYRFRLFECSPTHKKKWLTREAQGAPGNALGWL